MVRNINWIKVESSNIDFVSYKEQEEKLFVKFKSRKKEEYYSYSGVDVLVFGEFMIAPSKGKFLIAEINGKYDFEKTEAE